MSKIGSQTNIGATFKPTITNASYDNLIAMMNSNVSLNVNNALIFSIPQNEDGEDIINEGSIWMTDADGYLYPITKPINKK